MDTSMDAAPPTNIQAEYWRAADPAHLPALAAALLQSGLPGLLDTVPAYQSLYVEFDNRCLSREQLTAWLSSWTPRVQVAAGRCTDLPVCYDGEDLPAIAEFSGLSVAEVIRRHSAVLYNVRALGFVAGFPFMETTPAELQMPRRAAPRAQVPAHSLALAGAQTGIYPVAAPGGWNLLGRALSAVYDPQRDPAFLVQPGDQVRLVPQADGPALPDIQPLTLLPSSPASPVMRVVRPGALSLMMDQGRLRAGRFGLVRSGPLDAQAAALANALLDNPPHAPLLELRLQGPTLDILAPCSVAVTGTGLTAVLDGQPQPPYSAFPVRAGQRLRFVSNPLGRLAYLAVTGGFESQLFMNSASTDLSGGLGRPLEQGQLLGSALGSSAALVAHRQFLPWWVRGLRPAAPLTLRLGPAAPGESAEPALLRSAYRLDELGRMGARLSGSPVPGGDIVSEGAPIGTVQLPPGGQPIVLLNDKGTLGGYRRGGRVHPDDLPLLVQSWPGREIRFVPGG